MQVLVLGMHRSGTSIVTRLLNLLGFHIGDRDALMEPHVDNPAGFWERQDVYELNEEILARAGSGWDSATGDEVDVLSAADRSEFAARIAAVLKALGDAPNWVVKDPRLSVVLELWKGLLKAPAAVVVFRNPAQVAASLAARNGLGTGLSVALCESYALAALRATASIPRVFVSHEKLLADPVGVASTLAQRFEEFGASGLRLPDRSEIEAFVDRDLFRSRADDGTVGGFLNEQRRRLFEELSAGELATDWSDLELSADSRDLLSMRRECNLLQVRLNEAAAARERANAEKRELEQRCEQLLERCSSNDGIAAELAALKSEAEARDERLGESLRGELQRGSEGQAEVVDQITALHAQVARANDAVQGEIAALRQDLAEVRATEEQLRGRCRDVETELDAIHGSRMWRAWMKYHALRRRLLAPFASRDA